MQSSSKDVRGSTVRVPLREINQSKYVRKKYEQSCWPALAIFQCNNSFYFGRKKMFLLCRKTL
jgi:hypothetical protein